MKSSHKREAAKPDQIINGEYNQELSALLVLISISGQKL